MSTKLVGWMIIEDYCEDMSQWSGAICYPDPTGANLSWENPIKMIEHSAYAKLERENSELRGQIEWCMSSPMFDEHKRIKAENAELRAELARQQNRADNQISRKLHYWGESLDLKKERDQLREQVLKLEEHIDRLEAKK